MALLKSNLINGQKPEFGNPGHIKFIRKYEALAEMKPIPCELNSETRVIMEYSVKFTCGACSREVTDEWEQDEYDIPTTVISCPYCRAKYDLQDDATLKVKIE